MQPTLLLMILVVIGLIDQLSRTMRSDFIRGKESAPAIAEGSNAA
jgi:hypothetical protein